LPNERLAEEHKAVGFYLSGHPLDDYMVPLKRKNVMTLTEVERKAERGACVVKMCGAVASKQERKSARGNRYAFVSLSDPTGLYEVTVFSDTLEAAGDLLNAGSNVVLSIEATMESDQLKLLARGVQAVDGVAAEAGSMGLRVFIDRAEAVKSVSSVLERAAKDGTSRSGGPVVFCLIDASLPGEVELSLAKDYPVNPQIKGAIKSLGGVITVEEC